jgi:hypothetical protein
MVRCQDIGRNPKLTIQGDSALQGKGLGLRDGMDKPRLIYYKISLIYGGDMFLCLIPSVSIILILSILTTTIQIHVAANTSISVEHPPPCK